MLPKALGTGLLWLAGQAAALAANPAPAAVPDTMAQRLLACTGCHGPQGRATPQGFVPRLAGKPADYLARQLINYRDGRRSHALMAGLLSGLDDTYLHEIAAHFASQQLPYPPALAARAAPEVLARGRLLALQGDARRQLPACTACHGDALTGQAPALPGLLGLPHDYLVLQLGAWRHGVRRADGPDCMATIAQRLQPDDITAVAAWLAAQPVPADTRPAPAPRQPLPLACGSAAPLTLPAAAPPPAAQAQASATAAQRGAYLARIGHCAGCHTAAGGPAYAGGRAIATPFGTVFAGNLTPDATGLGGWTAEDFWRALHLGRGRDGRRLVPAFPYTEYTRVTRADSDALFAYLQSLPPVRQANRPHALRLPYGTQPALAVWQWLNHRPGVYSADTRRSAEWNRGAYLVQGLGHCAACHAGRNWLGATRGDGLTPEGGLIPQQGWYAPSLLSPHEAGVADWPLGELAAWLRSGQSARGVASGPMAEVVRGSTQYLSDADARAVALYLQSLPVRQDHRDAAPAAEPATLAAGQALYGRHCADCHGAQGQGVAGIYPALAGNRLLTMTPPVNAIRSLLDGGFAPATHAQPRPFGMPPTLLDDAELAALLTYLRQSWGHRAGAVSAWQVQQARDLKR